MPSSRYFSPWRLRPFDHDALGTRHGGGEAGNAQAAFFFELHAVALDELRVDHRVQRRPGPCRATDRSRRSSATRRLAAPPGRCPGAAYIVSIMSSISVSISGVIVVDGTRRLAQDRVPESQDGTKHGSGPGGRGAARDAAANARAGAGDARAKIDHRIAAEPLEQRVGEDEADHRLGHDRGRRAPRRCRCARWPPALLRAWSRSTDRSGFIRVEIGFMKPVTRSSSPLVTPPSRPPARLVGRTITGSPARGFRIGDDLIVDLRAGASRAINAVADRHRLDRRNRHQRLRETAIELAIPLHVAAESDAARCGRSPRTIRRGCRRLPWPHRSPPSSAVSIAVSTHRSGASGARAGPRRTTPRCRPERPRRRCR